MNPPFTKNLLKWNKASNSRSMPWKQEKDPYKIWLSEVILQQTRVEQGLQYYNNFIHAFPTVHDLANAPEQAVFKMWEGLGYYSRCKNLIATARFISKERNGKFPDTYDQIRSLKGVGPYTAAAIASFAYNLPYAVVDGNVFRVLSRYFGITTPVDTSDGKALYHQLADALLDKKQPGIYNQAIMDFGAVICKPQPLCQVCVQREECEAYNNQWVHRLPVKEKALKKKTRWLYYFMVEHNNKVYIKKRMGKDIWENLYEFVLQESDAALSLETPASAQQITESIVGHDKAKVVHISREYKQQLTHQTIIGQFITVRINDPAHFSSEYETVLSTELRNYPFPKFITAFLKEHTGLVS